MAPLPKKKRPQSKKRSRWSHSALKPTSLSTCPQCRNLKPPHRICGTCGYYAGQEILAVGPTEGAEEQS